MKKSLLLLITSVTLWANVYDLKPIKITEDVNCLIGDLNSPTIKNNGFISNVCYVDIGDSIVLLDSGATYLFAKELNDLIKKEYPNKKISHVVLTNFHDDRIQGASFFKDLGAKILGHKTLNEDIKANISKFDRMKNSLPKEIVEKTKVIFTKGKSGEAVKQKDVYNTIQTALNEYDFNKTLKIKPSSVSEDESVMKTIYKTLSKEGKNATLDKNNDYKIVAEQYGAKYDLDDSISAFNKAKEGKEFEVKAKAIVPSITKEDLEKNLFKDVLGEYTTTVNGSYVRKNNVRLAGEKCNVILLPGEEFSYNQTVGKRTKENGFGEAGAYLNGETVQEVGGGVCQASSTLYNAVVLANLEVTERTNHTYISSYVPIGRDATVSWGGPDFKFKNNRDYPIKIEASYAGGKLTCKIIGTDVDGSYVKFTSERTGDVAYNTKYENDATIPEGQQVTKQAGSNGGRAVSYRLVYDKDGKLLSKKKEAKSYYKGHEAIIAVGTMKVEHAPEAQPEATPATPETTIPAEPTTTQQ